MVVGSILDFVSTLFSLAIFIVGIVVFIRNYHSRVNRQFAFLAVATAIWIIVNSLSITTNNLQHAEINEFYSRLITPSSLITLLSFYYFTKYFPSGKFIASSKVDKTVLISTLVLCACSFTELNIKQGVANGEIKYDFGSLYILYIITISLLAIRGLGLLVYKARTLKGLHKLQAQTVLLGLVLTIVPAMISGVLLPIFGFYKLWDYTHLFSVFFIVLSAYSILKYRVFDVRLATFYVLVYITIALPLAAVTLLTLMVLGMNISGFDINKHDYYTIAVMALLGLPLLGFGRDWLNRLTRKIFYQGSYDLDSVLEDISRDSVLLDKTESIVKDIRQKYESSLRYSWMSIVLFHEGGRNLYYGDKKNFNADDIKYLTKKSEKLLVTGRIPPGRLYYFLVRRDVEVSIALHDTTKTVGILLLGPKLGGRQYTNVDMKLLEISANILAVSLSNALKFEKINKFNETLSKAVQTATKKLRVANDNLRQLDKLKNDYISATSHQLKPQITAVQGFLELMIDEKNSPKDKKEIKNLELALMGTKRISRIVSGVLEQSLHERINITLDKVEFNFTKLVNEEIASLSTLINKKQLVIVNKLDRSLLISADKEKCRESVYNLFNNAIIYSPYGGKIEIIANYDKDRLIFKVKDNGIGIPNREKSKLFTKYYRLPSSKINHPSGSGIGLYVVKLFIEAHGGDVFVDSKVGLGSTFGFSIPIKS